MSQNAILDEAGDLADAIAKQSLARREAQYASEVRRLLDAGLEVMRECGTASSPRVADIVAAAGLSNDAFYRHFASKEALVAAILEDGSARLTSYLRPPDGEGVDARRQGAALRRGGDVAGGRRRHRRDDARRAVERRHPQRTVWARVARRRRPRWRRCCTSRSRSSAAPSPDADAMLAAHAAVGTAVGLLVAAHPTDPGRDRPHRRVLPRGRHDPAARRPHRNDGPDDRRRRRHRRGRHGRSRRAPHRQRLLDRPRRRRGRASSDTSRTR